MAGASQQQSINIGGMPMEQLQYMREQLQEEDRFLTTSYSQLRVAQSKFTESRESLKAICPANAGTEIMVPITSSLYVKGTMDESLKAICPAKAGTDIMVPITSSLYVKGTVSPPSLHLATPHSG
ncbi:hypothetical protein T484DRAFT_2496317 [Baffinella frigidus]|nr:hypothetical protein T484DRAFT_2496317 [Cryptophyta sp. CCMP2293]